MIKGLRTAIYAVGDVEKGKSWYSQVLGKAPYFDEPWSKTWAAASSWRPSWIHLETFLESSKIRTSIPPVSSRHGEVVRAEDP